MLNQKTDKKIQKEMFDTFINEFFSGSFNELEGAAIKRKFIDFICRSSCVFYKPDVKEELACYAFEFITERLNYSIEPELLKNSMLKDEKDEQFNINNTYDDVFEEKLLLMVCRKCDFFSDGCDYRDDSVVYPNGSKKTPCGGLLVLRRYSSLLL